MPLWFYTLIHPEARLTAVETRALISGLEATLGTKGGKARDDREGRGPSKGPRASSSNARRLWWTSSPPRSATDERSRLLQALIRELEKSELAT